MARKTRMSAPQVIEEEEVEVLEQEKSSGSFDIGLMATTVFFLLAAVVMIVLVLKRDYDGGPLGG